MDRRTQWMAVVKKQINKQNRLDSNRKNTTDKFE